MKFEIQELANSSYDLNNNLYFNGIVNIYRQEERPFNYTTIVINKKSALEITHTLLDSLNMLDKNAENLLDKIEERIENGI
jgi:hypothetical protein